MTKILIIDDTVLLRESIAEALEFEGFDVIQAGDGVTLSLIHISEPTRPY